MTGYLHLSFQLGYQTPEAREHFRNGVITRHVKGSWPGYERELSVAWSKGLRDSQTGEKRDGPLRLGLVRANH